MKMYFVSPIVILTCCFVASLSVVRAEDAKRPNVLLLRSTICDRHWVVTAIPSPSRQTLTVWPIVARCSIARIVSWPCVAHRGFR